MDRGVEVLEGSKIEGSERQRLGMVGLHASPQEAVSTKALVGGGQGPDEKERWRRLVGPIWIGMDGSSVRHIACLGRLRICLSARCLSDGIVFGLDRWNDG